MLVKTGHGEAELQRHDGAMPGAAHVARDTDGSGVVDSERAGHSPGGA